MGCLAESEARYINRNWGDTSRFKLKINCADCSIKGSMHLKSKQAFEEPETVAEKIIDNFINECKGWSRALTTHPPRPYFREFKLNVVEQITRMSYRVLIPRR